MDIKHFLKALCICLLLLFIGTELSAQAPSSTTVLVEKTIREDGRARVTKITNNSNTVVTVILKDKGESKKFIIKAGENKTLDLCCSLIYINQDPKNGRNGTIRLWRQDAVSTPKEEMQNSAQSVTEEVKKDKTKGEHSKKGGNNNPKEKIVIKKGQVRADFQKFIEAIPYYSSIAIENEASEVSKNVRDLDNSKNRASYISDHQLDSFLNDARDSLEYYKERKDSLIEDFLNRYTNYEACKNNLSDILDRKLEQRERNLRLLESVLHLSSGGDQPFWKKMNWKLIGICTCALVFLIILTKWYKKAKKKEKKTPIQQAGHSMTDAEASSVIVVRRKTTSVLRKQSLDDVIDNENYMKLDSSEFCDSSAVRSVYIKNSCIKDIYNMYAEDLRNPDNPKEDGCMVLGRWVHDKDSNEYDISLEQIVLPGDDAVFSEYELNFGGKIKLKVTERLRKLRRETNLQYDLTCWVHSHPGLGVFFSNSDTNVQTQLKHPSHPNFLTAIVVDILTPEQKMGIFTFSKDGAINSDLKKMYSLEELYKWAVESERSSFKPEDHYNTLAGAQKHIAGCHGIELSNGAVIDMGMLASEPDSTSIGIVHGFNHSKGDETEWVVTAVSKAETVPDAEKIGCFVMAAHCSIPSVRKQVASYLGKIHFVMVYSTSDGLLTSIPVINQDLCSDAEYYGEQQLEDLKIWTRRKR